MSVVTPTTSSTKKELTRLRSIEDRKAASHAQRVLDGDEVSVSLLTPSQQDEAERLLETMFAKAKDTLKRASQLRTLERTVVFAENVANYEELFVHPGVFENGSFQSTASDKSGDLDIDSILSAEVLLVAPRVYHYDPRQVTIVENVKVSIQSQNPNRPKLLHFSTGGEYHLLYGGYSIQKCLHLPITQSISLSGEVRKREASVENGEEEVSPVRLKME